jgi:transcriptional regulator with GAF, ATPase, and Fis domain/tRNA A-37 threonylcarbamoyl transferase component Bud32/predicted negative regulator of RcsB-dependent stress response
MLPEVVDGRFRLRRELGRGGMGVVYLADEEGRDRPVALKVLLARRYSDSALRHFEQEFRTLTALSHPHLTEVYDFGRVRLTDEDRQVPYFTMEFVDGAPLDRFARERIEEDGLEALYPVLAQAGQALAYLHGQGIVHRDVKPSNLLVAPDGPGGAARLRLMDLGLAGRPQPAAGAGRIRGTVTYLSPEAAGGDAVDARSDLYALGCVIYELLTGRPPFTGSNALAVLRGHLEEEPLAPSVLRPGVPGPVDALVLGLLAKDPADRPASADRFLRQLDEVAGGTLEVETPEVRRHRVLGGGFVGRERELARLEALLEQQEETRPLLLVGEAGVGKTRLLREFRVRCQLRDFDVFGAHAGEGRGGMIEVLRRAVRARGPLSEETRRRHAAALVALLGEAPDGDASGPEPTPDGETGTAAAERLWLPGAAVAVLRDLTAERPLGLVIEDLHVADEMTCNLLRHVALALATPAAGGTAPNVLLLGSYRGEEVSRSSPLFELLAEVRREAGLEELFLDPLGPRETAALVRARCGADEVPPPFLERLIQETRGNPLHVGELLALLAEEGLLRPGDETPFDPEALDRFELPGKVRDLLARRLDRIAAAPRQVLVAGAALHRTLLDPDAIAAITGKRWEHVVRQLIELLESGLIQREEADDGTPLYRTLHPGLGELALERCDESERRKLHAGAVSYLERRGLERGHRAWSDFGRHAESAAQPGRAIDAYARAGDLAREVHANRDAIRLYGQAIDLALRGAGVATTVVGGLYERRASTHALVGDLAHAEEDGRWMLARAERDTHDPLKARAHLVLGRVLALRGRYDEAQESLELAQAIADRVGDDGLAAEARIRLGRVAAELGQFDEGLEQLERAGEQARAAGRDDLDLEALLSRGALHRDRGDYRRSLRCYEEAAARTGGRARAEVEEEIRQGAALALEVQGEFRRALDGYLEARERAEARGDVRAVAALTDRIGGLHVKMGDPIAAGREIEEALDMHRKLGAREGVIRSLHHLARLHDRAGRKEAARELAEEALGLARRAGTADLIAASHNVIGRLHVEMGDLSGAASALEQAERLMQDARNPRSLAALRLDVGNLRRFEGNPEDARRQYQEAAFLARKNGDRRLESIAMRSLGEAHLDERDYDRASVACRKAQKLVDDTGLGREKADARLLHARIELGRPGGDVVGAEIESIEALRVYREAHDPERVWQAEHAAGRAELRLQRRDEARERIERAHRYLEGVRARLGEAWRETFLRHPSRAAVYEDWDRLRETGAGVEVHDSAAADAGELARTRQELEAMRRLLEINRALGSTRDTDELLRVILDAALELTGAERGFLLVRDGEELTTRSARAVGGESLKGEALELSRSIALRTMESGEPLLSTDAEADERLSGIESVHDLHIRSVLAVPLPAASNLAGALYLDSRLGRRIFTPTHLELCARLADQAALALAAAHMLAENERQRSHLDRLNRELERTAAAQREELAEAREALLISRSSLELRYSFEELIGAEPAMQQVYHLIERLAPKKLPVLVVGESGTGKELIARALHKKSARSGGPFFTINCAAVNETLLESELFGYRKGAFTGADRDKPGYFELAHGGTLFLDEIGEMGQAMQAKLLGAIERGEVLPVGGKSPVRVDVRIVAATHRDLPEMIREGGFREDLYYRVNVGRIPVPPLRRRRQDIPLLVEHFLQILAAEEEREKLEIEPAALKLLMTQAWPGNVRELQHQILRVATFVKGTLITARDLRRYGDLAPVGAAAPQAADDGHVESLEEMEKRQIRRALEEAGGNKTRAAEILGINRATLFRKIKRLSL